MSKQACELLAGQLGRETGGRGELCGFGQGGDIVQHVFECTSDCHGIK